MARGEAIRSDRDLAADAWALMWSLATRGRDALPQIAASFGLNPGAMNALLFLDPDEPKPMGALAEAWKCDASNVTWVVDRLEERGLAERRLHPSDRRVRTVALTRKGVRLREQARSKLLEAPEVLRSLSESDLETLCRVLRKVTDTGS